MTDAITKTQVAAFLRGIEADASESAIIRLAAARAADSLDASCANGVIRTLQGAFTNGTDDTVKLTSILVAGALALTCCPDLPAEL